jgi:hypothetical protein
MERSVALGLQKLSATGLAWHWGLAVDNDFYEVTAMGGMNEDGMTVVGPQGIVATSARNPPTRTVSRQRFDYDGYIELCAITQMSNEEIEAFITSWVERHAQYSVLGPNCQDFVLDFHLFLTGEPLQYTKDNARVGKGLSNGLKAAWKRPSKQDVKSDAVGKLGSFLWGTLQGAYSIKGPQDSADVQWTKRQGSQIKTEEPNHGSPAPERLNSHE